MLSMLLLVINGFTFNYLSNEVHLPIININFQADDRYVLNDVTIGIRKTDIEELAEYVTANDKEGFVAAVHAKVKDGSAFRIAKGTKVRVLDLGFFYSKIRVLDGPKKNKVGFMDTSQLSK